MIGFKATKEFKTFLQEMAQKENRTLSNFIINALLTYIKEHRGIEFGENSPKPKPQSAAVKKENDARGENSPKPSK